ncbi:hypothetical protein F5Y01DRAFT_310931 [Xylaria sp. FL0043]|nr:hypothetical protein F5Y01DRAFT_310931 [Xylaria sp. FL0043]
MASMINGCKSSSVLGAVSSMPTSQPVSAPSCTVSRTTASLRALRPYVRPTDGYDHFDPAVFEDIHRRRLFWNPILIGIFEKYTMESAHIPASSANGLFNTSIILTGIFTHATGLSFSNEFGSRTCGSDIEGIEGGGSVGNAAGNDNNNDDAVSSFGLLGASSTPQPSKTHPTSPKKRKYTNVATSTRDEDGQEAFAVEISTEMRSWNSRGKKKTKQEKAKQKQLAKKNITL